MADYIIPDRVEKRVRYSDEQFLKDQDFIDEQKYHINRQRLPNRLHVSGIIEGLEVDDKSEKGKIIVKPGTAIDKEGRMIVLVKQEKINNPTPGNLVISYQQKESDLDTPVHDNATQTNGKATRWYEYPEVKVVITDPSDEQVVLGKITNEQNTLKFDPSNREYSGVFLPAGKCKGVTLRSHGKDNPDLADLTGSLSIKGKLCVEEKTVLHKDLEVKGKLTVGSTTITNGIIQTGKYKIKIPEKNPDLSRQSRTIKTEFEAGQKLHTEDEEKQRKLQETSLRISGAIQVHKEVIAEADSEANGEVSQPDDRFAELQPLGELAASREET